ncbi:hypothetical protein HJFPF1_03853 [Paramyrothecium foliicola]|nr:hypothetical protein HJFPF1_03853 [Paramyrothecium foliicola]
MVLRATVVAAAGLVGVAVASARYGAMSVNDAILVPRHFQDKSVPLLKREGACAANYHGCLDVGRGSNCCSNNSYCYITSSDELRCCPNGSDCPDNNQCARDKFRCYETQTITRSAEATPLVTSRAGCCNRACPKSSQYLCPPDRGGRCCPYGFECRANGNCERFVPESQPPVVNQIPEGCTTTSQFLCADGQGCCDEGRVCTIASNTAYCSLALTTDTNVAEVDGSPGLSEGAKAGIAIGAIFGAGIIIAAVTWLCITRRRRRRQQTATQQSAPSAAGGQPYYDGMTELTASTRPPANGLTQDYFGPDAVVGPFTETVISTAATSPNPERTGVPSQPQSPGDIAVPVEIDSRAQSPESERTNSYYATPMSHLVDGRYELYEVNASSAHMLPPRRRSPSLQRTPPNLTPRDELP